MRPGYGPGMNQPHHHPVPPHVMAPPHQPVAYPHYQAVPAHHVMAPPHHPVAYPHNIQQPIHGPGYH